MWVAIYVFIGCFVLFAIIPEKSILFTLGLLVTGIASYLFMKYVPDPNYRCEEYEMSKNRKPPS